MEKNERIEQKRTELALLLDGVPEIQKKIAADLIEQAAFLAVTLEDLAEKINQDGTIETYTNGEHQTGRKMSSDAKLYATLISRYSSIISKLLKLVPGGRHKKYESPENVLASRIEERNSFDEEYEKEKGQAFIEAQRNGTAKWNDYATFSKEYDEEHMEEQQDRHEAKEKEFLNLLAAGKICQEDYYDFMNHKND